ncbi:hypothetical protein FRC07_014730, partial [Ceratobasidium sp. 392]
LEKSLILQDLYCRIYLTGSDEDRQVLQKWMKPFTGFGPLGLSAADEKDSEAVLEAYAALLHASQQNVVHAHTLPVDVVASLGDFVMAMVAINPSAALEEFLYVLHQVFGYYWLLLKYPGGVAAHDQRYFKSLIWHVLNIIV